MFSGGHETRNLRYVLLAKVRVVCSHCNETSVMIVKGVAYLIFVCITMHASIVLVRCQFCQLM